MKTWAVIFYIIGCGLLIASCFTTGVALTWWLGGGAVVALIVGCFFQYNSSSRRRSYRSEDPNRSRYDRN